MSIRMTHELLECICRLHKLFPDRSAEQLMADLEQAVDGVDPGDIWENVDEQRLPSMREFFEWYRGSPGDSV